MLNTDPDESHRPLRRAEVATHAAWWLAVATTLLVVDVVPGAESNPVSAWLIAHGGLLAWALTTPVAVAGGFALLRWARRHHESPSDRLRTHHLGGLVAGGLALDAVGNLLALALLQPTWTVRWQALAVESGAVALLAAVLVVRPDPRRLRSVGRAVTGWLSVVKSWYYTQSVSTNREFLLHRQVIAK